jgi:hypothetical protein
MTLGEIETWFEKALYLLITGNLRELTIVQAIVLAILIIGFIVVIGGIFEGVLGFIGDLLEDIIESDFIQNHGVLFIIILILVSLFIIIIFS